MHETQTPNPPGPRRARERAHALLLLVLGLWIGGSVVIGAVVSYNLTGFDELFTRNQALAERAGFDPAITAEKKVSLLWVHASELNRVFFERWGQTQLVLAALALALALVARVRRPPAHLLVAALVLAAALHWIIAPQIVEIGRTLDFVPRSPPPPQWADFGRAHGIFFAVESLRFALVLIYATWLVVAGRRR